MTRDAAVVRKPEAVWLRDFLEVWAGDIVFSVDVEAQMRDLKVSRADILHVLRAGDVVGSEKTERGANWTVEGRTCDDEWLRIELDVEVNIIRVVVIGVRRT